MTLPATRAQVAALIPHQGSMCLWDEVIAADARSVHCRSRGHRDPQHPLRRDGRLSGIHLVEYGAQLMAIHGALAGDAAGRPGVLAALREVEISAEVLDGISDALDGHAERLVHNPQGSMYQCRVEAGGRVLLRARVSVVVPSGL